MTEQQAYLIFCLEPLICIILSVLLIFAWDKLRESDQGDEEKP